MGVELERYERYVAINLPALRAYFAGSPPFLSFNCSRITAARMFSLRKDAKSTKKFIMKIPSDGFENIL